MGPEDFIELLDEQMKLIAVYQEIYELFVDSDDLNQETWEAVTMSSQFQWLKLKFSALWFDDIILDEFINKNRPEYKLFSPEEFELLIQAAMFLITGKWYSTTKGSHDEGIDLIKTDNFYTIDGLAISATTIVQCKLYRDSVPITDLRDFFGVMTAHTATGFFFTTSSLSSQAINRFLPKANSSSMANRLYVIAGDVLPALFAHCENIAESLIYSFNEKLAPDFALINLNRANAKKILYAEIKQQSLF